jgi:hypothetical protein
MYSTESKITEPVVLALIDFNKELCSKMKEMTVHRYVEEMNEKFFHMDLSFMEENLEYVLKDGCCFIPHTKLWDMGVFKKDTTSHIRKLLIETHNFEQGKDFDCKTYKNKNGGKPSKKYFMTPDAYFLCLLRTKNTRKYADYFIMLQKAVLYHSMYHKELSEGRALLSKKAEEKAKKETKVVKKERDDVMKKFYENIEAHEKKMKKAEEKREEERNKAEEKREEERNKAEEKMKKAEEKREEERNKAEEKRKKAEEQYSAKMDQAFEKITELCQQRVPDPPKVNQKEQIKIVKLSQLNNDSPMYYIMRRQQKGMTSAINELAHKRTVERVVVTINTPNAKNMFLRARGLLGDKMTVRGNVVTPKKNKVGLTPLEIRDIFTSIKTNDTTVTLEE